MEQKESETGKARPLDFLKAVAIILGVVCLGLFTVNQFLSYYYKAQFLKTPCDLCGEYNPEVVTCIKDLNTRASYPDGNGSWTNPSQDLYNYSIRYMP